MSWTTVENALRAWVVTASGLADDRVRWANQQVKRPAPPTTWVEMRLGLMRPVGITDGVVMTYDEDADAGEEFEIRAIGHRESDLAIQVYGTALGAGGARDLAEQIQLALELPSVDAALDAAGVSVFDRGSIQHVPRVLETDWEGRAVLTVRFYTVAEVAETTGYIETTNVELPEQGIEFEAP